MATLSTLQHTHTHGFIGGGDKSEETTFVGITINHLPLMNFSKL